MIVVVVVVDDVVDDVVDEVVELVDEVVELVDEVDELLGVGSSAREPLSVVPKTVMRMFWVPVGCVSYAFPGASTEAVVAPSGQAAKPLASVVTASPTSNVTLSPEIAPLAPVKVTPAGSESSRVQGPAFAVASTAKS